jgi:enoyl-CoA hydratase/carnithine racemase
MYLEKDGRLARLVLNRPAVLNAANLQWVDDLTALADAVASDEAIRVVTVTGAGRAFCSGIDLKALSAGETPQRFFDDWERALRAFESMDKVVIAGMHGYAIGGGLQLGLACDVRVAATGTQLGLTAVKECLLPGLGIYRLPRFVGMGRAKRLILTGELIGAEEAERIGLVDFVVQADRFEAELRAIADRLGRTASRAACLAKRVMRQAFESPFEPFLQAYLEAQREATASADHREAMRAYREGREPRF